MKIRIELPSDHWSLRTRLPELFLGLSLAVFGLYVTFLMPEQVPLPSALLPSAANTYVDRTAVGPVFLMNGVFGVSTLVFTKTRQTLLGWFSTFMYSGAYATIALWSRVIENDSMFPFMCMLVLLAMYCLVIRSCRLIVEFLQ